MIMNDNNISIDMLSYSNELMRKRMRRVDSITKIQNHRKYSTNKYSNLAVDEE